MAVSFGTSSPNLMLAQTHRYVRERGGVEDYNRSKGERYRRSNARKQFKLFKVSKQRVSSRCKVTDTEGQKKQQDF